MHACVISTYRGRAGRSGPVLVVVWPARTTARARRPPGTMRKAVHVRLHDNVHVAPLLMKDRFRWWDLYITCFNFPPN